jgi:hypothetical protein
MADVIYEVEAPDGTRLKFSGPEDASQADIQAFAQQQFKALSGNKNQVAEDERIEILVSEFKKAKAAGAKEDADAVGRELARLGVDASTIQIEKPREVEVSAEDYIREKAKALGELIENNPVQAAQLAASGIGAVGGAALNPALKGAVGYVQEASQRPAFTNPGTPSAQTTAKPQFSPTTSGEKWSLNWANQERPNVGGVPEASAAYNRSKGQGKVTSRMSKMWGPPPPSAPGQLPTSLADRLIEKSAAAGSEVQKTVSPLTKATETIQGVGRLGANMVGDLLRSKAMGALGGGMAVYEGLEALKQLREGNTEEAALSGIGALGGITSMVPTIPTAVIGGGLSAIPYLYRAYKSSTQNQPQQPVTQEEMQAAQRPAFIYARP